LDEHFVGPEAERREIRCLMKKIPLPPFQTKDLAIRHHEQIVSPREQLGFRKSRRRRIQFDEVAISHEGDVRWPGKQRRSILRHGKFLKSPWRQAHLDLARPRVGEELVVV
jgi:hypothetical protein